MIGSSKESEPGITALRQMIGSSKESEPGTTVLENSENIIDVFMNI
jgi:hypothetical protein